MSKRRVFIRNRNSRLREAYAKGTFVTCRKLEIAQSLFYPRMHVFNQKGIEIIKGQYYRVDPEVKYFLEENKKSKKIIGKQALKLEVKNELLKLSADRL